MSDLLPFPNQASRYERMGKKELAAGAYFEAMDYLEKAYHIDANWERNRLLVTTYLEVGQPEEALIIANEYMTDYLQSEEGFSQYISLLIHNRKILKAHLLVRNARLSDNMKAELTHQLTAIDETLLKLNKMEIQTTQLWLKKQASSSLYSHLFYQKIGSLPIEAFVESSQYLISQGTTLPVYRRYLLEQVVQLKLTGDWSICLYDGKCETFSLMELMPFTKQAHVQTLDTLLYELIGQTVQYRELKEILHLYLSIMYPKKWPKQLEFKIWLCCFLSAYLPEMAKKKEKLLVDLKPYEAHLASIKKVLEQNEPINKV